jgi:hypothetical protein
MAKILHGLLADKRNFFLLLKNIKLVIISDLSLVQWEIEPPNPRRSSY